MNILKRINVFARTFAFAASFSIAINASAQSSGPSSINISGGLFNSSGAAVTASSVSFKIDIYDKTGTCLLYTENHLGEDLSTTKGAFSLAVGRGSSPQNLIDLSSPTAMTSKVYENVGVIAGGWAGCASGATLANGDERMIRVTYDLGSGPVVMTPDVPMASAAYAMVAETLQGKRPSDFLQVRDDVPTDLSQANLENIFSASNYTKLNALVSGSSSQYMVSSPSAAVGFNGQRITNVATPSASGDAATKGYTDGSIGGKTADVSGVGPAVGDGYTLIWDQAGQKWTTGTPTATDNTKLPLAGGTMTGALNMGGQNLLATGHITMSPLKTLTFGTLDTAQETTLIGTLLPANAGASWYNSQTKILKVWDGTAAIAQVYSVNGKTGGAITLNANDLGLGTAALENVGTGVGNVPQLDAGGKIPAALLPSTTWSDILNAGGSYMNYMPNNVACADGKVLKYDLTNTRWICGDDNNSFSGSAAGGDLAGTYPNPTIAANAVVTAKINDGAIVASKVFPAAGVNRIVATDGSTGTTLVPFECTGTQIMQWSGTGWSCQNVSAVLPASMIADGGNARGADLSIGSNDNFALNFRTNNTNKMMITSAGNVGIGTNNPARLLHVEGPMRITPAALPGTPAAGELAFDSGSANALKFYDGSAWQTVGTGTGSGDFLKNGSVAMTGALQMGSQNITGVGTNITSSAALTIANTGANSLSLSSNGTNATAVNIAVAGANGGITLAPNGTGVVTASRPIVITPSTVPASTAGTIFFDSAASNAMKYFDGTAWVSLGTGTGDFLKNGSVAMTGALQMGTQNITGVGTNITATAGLTVAQAAGSAMVVGSSSGASSMNVNSGTGGLNVTGTGTTTVTSSKVAAGATTLSSSGGTTATTLVTSNGTGSDAVNITSTGANSGITLAPNGTGVVTTSRPLVITPTAASPNTAGAMWFDSGSGNAFKYHNGSAWVALGSGTGDFLKNGSVAMTGNFDAGANNLDNVGAINGSSSLTVSQGSGFGMSIGSSGGGATIQVQSGTGNATFTGAGVSTLSSSKVAAGATVVSSTGGTSATTLITSNGTSASAVNITSTGVNSGITLAPNGTGVVTASRPIVITPTTVPASTAGTIFFDSAASNAMKYFDGTAWVALGTGTGDFLKNGSVAMTGALQMGSQNITGVGTNITATAGVTVAQAAGSAMVVGSNSGASTMTVNSGTGGLNVTGAGTTLVTSSKVAAGATTLSSTGGTTATTLVTSNGTGADAVNITSTGANSGITLAPNGTGVVTSSRPLVITPSTVPTATAGTLFFDSAASNALKYYNGSGWQTVGTGGGSGDFKADGSVSMTGVFKATSGSFPNPSIEFAAEPGLGLWRSGVNQMGILSNGAAIATFTPTTIMGPGFSGTGTNANTYTTTSAATAYPLGGYSSGSFVGRNDNALDNSGSMLSLTSKNSAGDWQSGYITTVSQNTGYSPVIAIGQQTGFTAYAERMRIDASGNLGIGTTSPARLLHVNGPMRITPAALPSSPAAGELAFDSGSSNALKYHDGSAWVTVGSGSGDFLKNGSVAMTGALQMGSQNITGVGTNITATAGVTVAQAAGSAMVVGSNSGASTMTVNSGTGGLNVSGTGTTTVTSSKVAAGATSLSSTGGTTATTLVTSNGTGADAVNITSTGANSGITLAPNGTGVVTSSRPMVITPTAASPNTAGAIWFDSGSSNAFKYHNGSAWVALGSGTGDFLKNGSVAMTGALDMGTQNITNVGTNITATAGLTVAQAAGSALTLGQTSGASNLLLQSGSGGVLVNSTGTTATALQLNAASAGGGIRLTANTTGDIVMLPGTTSGSVILGSAASTGSVMIRTAGQSTLTSAQVAAGATTVSSTGGTTATTLITSNGTGADAVNLTSTGANSGITLAPNGTGVVTSSRPIVISPTAASPNTAGALWFDSGASNALKYYDGSAWVSAGGGGSGDFLKNGTIAMTGAFNAGGNQILGNTIASANLDLESTSNATKGYLLLQKNGGNVGIGTNAPAAILEVSGVQTRFGTGSFSNMILGTGADLTGFPFIQRSSSVAGFSKCNNAGCGSAAWGLKVDMTSNTKVGIGVLGTPSYALSMSGDVGAQTLGIERTQSPGNGPNLTLVAGGGHTTADRSGGSLILSSGLATGTGSSTVQIQTAAAQGSSSSTDNVPATRVTIDGAGYVGIGTATPARLLHVNGPMRITPAALPGSPAAGELAFDSGASNALKYYDGSAWVSAGGGGGSGDFKADGSVDMTGQFKALPGSVGAPGISFVGAPTTGLWNSGNSVFIANGGSSSVIIDATATRSGTANNAWYMKNAGTISAASPTYAFTGDTNTGMYHTSVGNLAFATAGSERVRIDSSGNVGIGTNNPARLLQVEGPMRITPAALPSSPAAGELAFDSGSSNALKFYDGSAWQTVGTGSGSGDFLKNGSVAMTGALDMGTQSITNVGTNITGTNAGGLSIAQSAGTALVLGSNSAGSTSATLQTGNGQLTVTSARTAGTGLSLATTAGSNISMSAAAGGTISLASTGTTATAVEISTSGTNGGITLTPNGTGVVTSARPIVITPSTVPTSTAGSIFFDSAASNAMKYYNGSAWQTVGTGSGDFMKNGSVAMTGALDMGSQNISNLGTTINGSSSISMFQAAGNSMILGSMSGASSMTIQAGTGSMFINSNGNIGIAQEASSALNLGAPASTGGVNVRGAGTTTLTSSKVAAGATVVSSTGGTTATTLITSNGTSASAVNITSTGTNSGITLAPNGTGVVTSSRPLVITPSTVPTSTTGSIFFDSAASNAMKYYNGSAWQTVGTGSGDFMKNGSVAMTGAMDMGAQSITNIGTNITSAAALTVAQATGATLTAGSSSGASTTTVQSGTGGLNLTSSGVTATAVNITAPAAGGGVTISQNASGNVVIGNSSSTGNVTIQGAGTNTLTSSKAAAGATVVASSGGTTATTLITSNGTSASAVNITSTGANSGITLAPNGTGVVTSSRPMVLTPTAASPNTTGALWIDSGASNALKYYNGSAWVAAGGGGGGDFMKDGSVAMTGALRASAGTASLPSLAFTGDPDTGFYNTSGGQIGLANDGVLYWVLGTAGYISANVVGGVRLTQGISAAAPPYTFVGDTSNDTGLFRPAENNIAITTGGLERVRVDASGNVGIGNTPTAKLDVTGQIRTAVYNATTSMAIDWNNGNTQYNAPAGNACGAITFTNMLDGGSYSLAVQGVTSGTCTFSQAGLTFVYSPANAGVTADAVYSFMRMGSKVYVSWVTGFL